VRSEASAIGSLPDLERAFQRATGWSLQYTPGPQRKPPTDLSWSAPVSPGVGTPLGHLRLGAVEAGSDLAGPSVPQRSAAADDSGMAGPPVSWESARGLASAVAGMLGELVQTRVALRQREADLASAVPLVAETHEEQHLALRLEAAIRGGAEALRCHAAALYLLDAGTSSLKLRSCWGLPWDRLTAPPRPLQGAVADLESLLGHAVVLSDATLMRHWRVPEDFPAAACVPVSSPTTILGTLWVFSNEERDFDDHETNILEVVAGRVAAELERERLWQETRAAADLQVQMTAAQR
jgi:hypothetical protein